jgi:hypothetical protein
LHFAILVYRGFQFHQTSTEEYVLEGNSMQGFANLTKNKWFLLMTSIILSAYASFYPEVSKMGNIILYIYVNRLILGVLTLMDEGMELAFRFHAANNLVSAFISYQTGSTFQTHSIFKDISELLGAGLLDLAASTVILPNNFFIYIYKK